MVNYAAKDVYLYLLQGRPIINIDKVCAVIVGKRSFRSGFSGTDNELFYNQKTPMIFGNIKVGVTYTVQLLKVRVKRN